MSASGSAPATMMAARSRALSSRSGNVDQPRHEQAPRRPMRSPRSRRNRADSSGGCPATSANPVAPTKPPASTAGQRDRRSASSSPRTTPLDSHTVHESVRRIRDDSRCQASASYATATTTTTMMCCTRFPRKLNADPRRPCTYRGSLLLARHRPTHAAVPGRRDASAPMRPRARPPAGSTIRTGRQTRSYRGRAPRIRFATPPAATR